LLFGTVVGVARSWRFQIQKQA